RAVMVRLAFGRSAYQRPLANLLRLQLTRLLEVGARPFEVALLLPCFAANAVRTSELRIEPDGRGRIGDRSVHVALLEAGAAAGVVGGGTVAIERQGVRVGVARPGDVGGLCFLAAGRVQRGEGVPSLLGRGGDSGSAKRQDEEARGGR